MVRSATAHENHTLTIRRTFSVSRKQLFDAWTDPDQLSQWFGPTPEHTIEVREYDFRVGGRYKLAFSKGGEPACDVVSGEFREIESPSRVSYTWCWAPPTDNAGVDTIVAVEFIERGEQTELVLTHTRFSTDEMRGHHEQGWGGCLQSLSSFLAK